MRQISSIQAIGTDALEGIEDLGEAGAGYAGEHTQGSDTTTPQVGKWRIPVWWIDTEPKTTQQLLDDANVDVEAWLSGKVSDKFSRFENLEFVTGATGKIRGFTTYTNTEDTGSGVPWGEVGFVKSGANGDFAATTPADKLFDLIGVLKNFYLPNSRWVTRRSVITKIRKFKDSQNQYLWQPGLIAGQPEMILGYPISRFEDMPALATNSYSLAFGDFRAGYQIVDRMGIRVIRDNLTSKPYVKFYTTKRTGGGILNYESFKLMKFAA
jgi:HK97 family phage major capsid protein